VSAVELEGRLTAALALAIAGDVCTARFRRFFFRLAAPANLVDKILDAREDHARGEIVIAPNLALYATLALALTRRVVALLLTAPRPILLARLGLRYLVAAALGR
jgi:hypothetical protein